VPRINNPKVPKRAKDLGRKTKKKPCAFCQRAIAHVDYKDINQLRKYVSDRGKIRGRFVTGNCQQHQRDVAEAIKIARELALLPYTQRTVTERRGGRGRGDRGERGDRGDRGRAESRAESPAEVATPEVDAETASDELIAEAVAE
jgi:small subunit ribosomal protein S18